MTKYGGRREEEEGGGGRREEEEGGEKGGRGWMEKEEGRRGWGRKKEEEGGEGWGKRRVGKDGGRGGWRRKEGGMGNNSEHTVGFVLFSQTTTSYEYILLIHWAICSSHKTVPLVQVKVVTISCDSFVPTFPPTQSCLSTVAIVMHSYRSLMLCIATLLSLDRCLG